VLVGRTRAPAPQCDNFVDLNYAKGTPIVDFSASRLFMNETDGSSFPNGGLRKSHSAAAYMAWYKRQSRSHFRGQDVRGVSRSRVVVFG